LTKEDLCQEVVEEVLKEPSTRKKVNMKKMREIAQILKENEAFSRALDHQVAVIGTLEKVVSHLEEVLAERQKWQKGDVSNMNNENHVDDECAIIEPISVDYSHVKFGYEEQKCFNDMEGSSFAVKERSNMYTRRENDPRQRFKSRALKNTLDYLLVEKTKACLMAYVSLITSF